MEQNEKMQVEKPESFKSRIERDVAEGRLTREEADKIVAIVRAKYDEIAAEPAAKQG